MKTTRLSSKGQIILPSSIRVAHNWQPGLEFAVEDLGHGVLLKPVKVFKTTTFDEIVGCTGYAGPAHTQDDMEQGIATGASGK